MVSLSDATSFEEWQAAMALQYIASFNFVYANEDGVIHFVHNAMMPDRAEGWQWDQYLPGDRARLIWQSYLPPSLAECDEPPQVMFTVPINPLFRSAPRAATRSSPIIPRRAAGPHA